MFNWAVCTISLIVSNLSCFALCSYFLSILPTKRNLLTYLNNLLVITMTFLVNFMVSKESLLKGPPSFIYHCHLTFSPDTFIA